MDGPDPGKLSQDTRQALILGGGPQGLGQRDHCSDRQEHVVISNAAGPRFVEIRKGSAFDVTQLGIFCSEQSITGMELVVSAKPKPVITRDLIPVLLLGIPLGIRAVTLAWQRRSKLWQGRSI